MPIYQAIILGIVQGLSEFLPISSSGHLLLVPWLAGWEELDPSIKKSFDVALHLGTLVAVVGYFWRDVSTYVVEGTKLVFVRKVPPTTDGKLAWLFVLATLPAAAVGSTVRGPDRQPSRHPDDHRHLADRVRHLARDRRPHARPTQGRGVPSQGRAARRCRTGAGAQPRHVTIGHHDDRGPIPRASTAKRRCGSAS